MTRTLGIELKGNRSIYVALEGFSSDFKVIDSGYFELKSSKDQKVVKSFYAQWMAYIEENDYHQIGIKERISKGRFSGGPLSFKMEGLIQLSDYNIQVIHSATIRNKLKGLDPAFGNIHSYQLESAKVAYYLLYQND